MLLSLYSSESVSSMVRWWLELEWAFFVDLPLHYTYLAFYYQDNCKTNMLYPLRTLDKRVQGIPPIGGLHELSLAGTGYPISYRKNHATFPVSVLWRFRDYLRLLMGRPLVIYYIKWVTTFLTHSNSIQLKANVVMTFSSCSLINRTQQYMMTVNPKEIVS